MNRQELHKKARSVGTQNETVTSRQTLTGAAREERTMVRRQRSGSLGIRAGNEGNKATTQRRHNARRGAPARQIHAQVCGAVAR